LTGNANQFSDTPRLTPLHGAWRASAQCDEFRDAVRAKLDRRTIYRMVNRVFPT